MWWTFVDREGQWVGRGFYNGHSRISLRVLTSDPAEAIDDAFFVRRIGQAVALRRDWLGLDAVTNAYRLVHSEGDGLSGLVVDRFGPLIVLEFFSAGMYRFRPAIESALAITFPAVDSTGSPRSTFRSRNRSIAVPPSAPAAEVITENGVRFRVAPGSKHKTGFFLDQRDNRHRLASFCKGKRVLDLCCNTGGFAVYAKAAGGADEVVGVDLDEQALALARQNAGLNQVRCVSCRPTCSPGCATSSPRGSVRRGGPRSGQADARPRGSRLCAEALSRHEPLGLAGRGAGGYLSDLFLHRVGERRRFPRHASPRRLASGTKRASAACCRRGGRSSVPVARTGGTLSESCVLPGGRS